MPWEFICQACNINVGFSFHWKMEAKVQKGHWDDLGKTDYVQPLFCLQKRGISRTLESKIILSNVQVFDNSRVFSFLVKYSLHLASYRHILQFCLFPISLVTCSHIFTGCFSSSWLLYSRVQKYSQLRIFMWAPHSLLTPVPWFKIPSESSLFPFYTSNVNPSFKCQLNISTWMIIGT